MEIILFDSANFGVERLETGDTHLKIQLEVNEESRTVGGNSLHEEYRQKIVAVSKEYSKIKSPSICIHVKKNPASPEDFTKCLVRVYGFLEENLDSLWVEGLKVRIQMSCLAFDSSDEVRFNNFPAQFCAEIPIDKPTSSSATNSSIGSGNEACILNGLFSEVKDVPTHNWQYLFKGFNPGKRTYVYGCVTVSLISDCCNPLINSANDELTLVNIEEQGLALICKKILDSKIHFDVTIVAKDGTVFDCNKNFLAAQSGVLATMLVTDIKEGKTNQIEMRDMTAIGVKALLKYIYTLDLVQAFENCDIALELLQAGHKYDIKSLEKEVSSIIIKKEVDWFTVDMAFSLFLFTRNVDFMEDIKVKSVSLLMTKAKEVMDCNSYQNLFNQNSAQSSEAVLELFCLSQAK